jgi:hypothetical protein
MRASLQVALETLGTINNAAEIGVLRGDFSKVILDSGTKFLYLVDPYIEDYMYMPDEMTSSERIMLNALKPYENKKLLKMTSVEASKMFSDGFFDYVYIDANHNYEFVRDDIAAWYPKVRSGGILGGHDFGSLETAGVMLAVAQFAQILNLHIYFSQQTIVSQLPSPDHGDWCVIKP